MAALRIHGYSVYVAWGCRYVIGPKSWPAPPENPPRSITVALPPTLALSYSEPEAAQSLTAINLYIVEKLLALIRVHIRAHTAIFSVML